MPPNPGMFNFEDCSPNIQYDSKNNPQMPKLSVTTFIEYSKYQAARGQKAIKASQSQLQGPVIPAFRRLLYQFKVSLS